MIILLIPIFQYFKYDFINLLFFIIKVIIVEIHTYDFIRINGFSIIHTIFIKLKVSFHFSILFLYFIILFNYCLVILTINIYISYLANLIISLIIQFFY